jgi:hypothetical protein
MEGEEETSFLKKLTYAVVAVLLLLLVWYVLANNLTTRNKLLEWGVAPTTLDYVPKFPCPQYALDKGYCNADGTWNSPLASDTPAPPSPPQPPVVPNPPVVPSSYYRQNFTPQGDLIRRQNIEGYCPNLLQKAGMCHAS